MATILIVDDCPHSRQHFATPLQRQGHRLLEASDGASALTLARIERPELIIADAQAPMANGFEMVHHLMTDRDLSHTRIILYSDRDLQREAIELTHAIRVPVVLPKPKKPEEVVSMVDLALSMHGDPAKPVADSLQRIDREYPRPSLKHATQVNAELERITVENGRLVAELRDRTEELKRAVVRREQAEQTLAKVQGWHQLGIRATNDVRLQALFDNSLDAILLVDDDQCFIDANPAACQMLRCSQQDILQMNVRDVTPPQYRDLADESWRQLLATGKTRGESTIVCKDGGLLAVEYRSVANALPGLHLSMMQDITERKRVEQELRESEERFRQLAEHIDEVFWINEPKQPESIYVSPAYKKLWGRSRDDLKISRQSWMEAIDAADRDRVIEAADKMFEVKAYNQTYRIVRPDGAIRWIKDRAFPIHDAAGNVIRMVGIAEDITDLKRVEEELRHYARRLEAMSEIDHAILAAASSNEIAKAVVSGIYRLVPCQRARVVQFDFDVGQALFLAVSVNGHLQPSTGTCIPIGSFGDIDDIRAGRVRVVEDFLAQPDTSAVGEMNLEAGIRSEITFPIVSQNALVGLFQLGREQAGAFDQEHIELAHEIGDRVAVAIQDAHLIEQIRSGQDRMRALTGQLMKAQEDERRRISRELHDEIGQALTITKTSLQTMDRTAEDFALATQHTLETIERVVQQVRNMSLDLRPPMLDDLGLVAALRGYLDRQAQSAGFSVRIDLDPIDHGLTPEIETASFRVVQEAMTNVVRHARASQVLVELRQHQADLRLVIRDDGVGFDVPAARRRAVRGESLGLLGLEERVKLLGGRINIESTDGRGTEIRVYFPLTR